MTKLVPSLGVCCVALVATVASAAMMMTMKPSIVPAGTATWMPMKGMNGLSYAVFYGTPSKAGTGVYAERYKATSDVTFPIHTHPTTELVTVLSGTLLFGTGDTMNWSSATSLTAGGFVGIPAGVHHYGKLKAGSIIEVSGLAPDTLVPVKMAKPSM